MFQRIWGLFFFCLFGLIGSIPADFFLGELFLFLLLPFFVFLVSLVLFLASCTNVNFVSPQPEFLEALSEIPEKYVRK